MVNRKRPACLSNNCEIADIMQDPASSEMIDQVSALIEIEALQESKGFDAMLNRRAQESGLINISSSTLFRLKSIFSEYRQSSKVKK